MPVVSSIRNKERLSNTLEFANSLLDRSGAGSFYGEDSLFMLVKILADKINCEQSLHVIQNPPAQSPIDIESLFMQKWDAKGAEQIQFYAKPVKIEKDLRISLSENAIIASTWSSDRISRRIKDAGTDKKPWEEDLGNHSVSLFLPIGLVISNNGNHSIFSGTVRRTGNLVIRPKSNHEVYDISHLYDIIRFDGTHYIDIKTKKNIGKASNFEFGCIFEIGRLMVERNISYPLSEHNKK